MFDWFKKDKTSNVIPFPEKKEDYITPAPAEEQKPSITYYRIGITNNNRVSLQMGYSEITMSADGVNNLIKQLEVFREQLTEEEDE